MLATYLGHLADVCFNLNMKRMNGAFGSGLEIRIERFQEKSPFDDEGESNISSWNLGYFLNSIIQFIL